MSCKKKSINIRKTILEMIYHSKSSHIWSAFSVVDILTYVYEKKFLQWDKLILSKWHAWSALYATMSELWKINKDFLIENYCKNWSKMWWHVTRNSVEWVEVSAWSLWHWLSIWIWLAMGFKNQKIYVIISDWELNEWSIWEWLLYAAHNKLSNLILIIDNNKQQAMWYTKNIMNIENLNEVLSLIWWDVKECNWHSFSELELAFWKLNSIKPNVIIANTIKWKWVSFMEDNIKFHYSPPNEEEFKNSLIELNKSWEIQ